MTEAAPCPICGRPSMERFRPFCSKRCADVDLGNWLEGRYAIPVAEDEADDDPRDPSGHDREPRL